MAKLGRPGLSNTQRRELRERWKAGDSISDIAVHCASTLGQCRCDLVGPPTLPVELVFIKSHRADPRHSAAWPDR